MKTNKVFGKIVTLFIGLLSILSLVGCKESNSKQANINNGKNKDNSFSMVTTWTSSGLVNHYNSNTSCEAFNYFVVEGLYRYVRSTDEIFPQLASKMPVHEKEPIDDYTDVIGKGAYDYYKNQGVKDVTVSKVEIKENAKWQNGEDFTAKDVWAYYYTIHPTSSNYMAGVKVVDTKNVEFIWNPLKEPVDNVKELLLSQDKSGTVKYDEFARFVDPIYQIVMESPVNQDQNLWGAFNRFSTDEQITRMNITRNAFYSTNPSWYIATGPFKLDTFTANQIKLVKNEYYWNADKINFDVIKLYSSQDLNQTYNLIERGYISYYDGFIQQDTLESMLANNSDLINLKMYDPGSIGITFNIKKHLFSNIEIRKAFQYILDRNEIRLASNPYAALSYYPLIGMAQSEAEKYMSQKHFNELPKYEYNREKAKELLQAAGWSVKEGKWYDENNKLVEINLAAPSAHDISSTAAEAVGAQLESFGIKTNVIKTTSFYGNAESDVSPYDLTLEWTDLNMSFSYPTGSYSQFSNIYSKWIHVDRYPNNYPDTQKAGQIKMTFDGFDGDNEKYEFANYINSFYSLSPDKLQYLVDIFNIGIAKQCLGIQLFQNVTSSTYNTSHIKGLPFEDVWTKERNVTNVPEVGTNDFFEVARTNLPFAGSYNFINGKYQPNKAQ